MGKDRGKENTMNESAVIQQQARAFIYLLLSKLFLYPDEEVLVIYGDNPVGKLRKAFSMLPYEANTKTISAKTPELLSTDEMKAAYISEFEQNSRAPLNEFTYRKDDYLDITKLLADISSFYKALGLRAEKAERHDHISTQLEFMGVCVSKEALAMQENLEEEPGICRDIQRKFFSDHLGCFYREVARYMKNTDSRFYNSLGNVLQAFLKGEELYLLQDNFNHQQNSVMQTREKG